MNTLREPRVAAAIDRMYAETVDQMARLGDFDWQRLAKASPQERADIFSEFYLPVTPESGRLLYTLVRAAAPPPSSSSECRWGSPRFTSPARCATTAQAGS